MKPLLLNAFVLVAVVFQVTSAALVARKNVVGAPAVEIATRTDEELSDTLDQLIAKLKEKKEVRMPLKSAELFSW